MTARPIVDAHIDGSNGLRSAHPALRVLRSFSPTDTNAGTSATTDAPTVIHIASDTDTVDVATIVAAERAQLALTDVVATAAPRHALLRVDDGRREPTRIDRVDPQQMERDALRGLRPDAGHAPELVDEVLDRAGVHAGRG